MPSAAALPPRAQVLLLLLLIRLGAAGAAASTPALPAGYPPTFWDDIDDPLKDIVSAGPRPIALRRYCPSDAAADWVRCADDQPSDWLLLQPHGKPPGSAERERGFSALLPLAAEGKAKEKGASDSKRTHTHLHRPDLAKGTRACTCTHAVETRLSRERVTPSQGRCALSLRLTRRYELYDLMRYLGMVCDTAYGYLCLEHDASALSARVIYGMANAEYRIRLY